MRSIKSVHCAAAMGHGESRCAVLVGDRYLRAYSPEDGGTGGLSQLGESWVLGPPPSWGTLYRFFSVRGAVLYRCLHVLCMFLYVLYRFLYACSMFV